MAWELYCSLLQHGLSHEQLDQLTCCCCCWGVGPVLPFWWPPLPPPPDAGPCLRNKDLNFIILQLHTPCATPRTTAPTDPLTLACLHGFESPPYTQQVAGCLLISRGVAARAGLVTW